MYPEGACHENDEGGTLADALQVQSGQACVVTGSRRWTSRRDS
jgi:hypothetical protein